MPILARLRVTDTEGELNRDIIVNEKITIFNLHRVLQFCIKPNQCDSTISGKAFSFEHVGSGKAVKAPKTTQLYRAPPGASNAAEIDVGEKYMYKPEGGGQYLVEIAEKATGDDRKFVPRCISGNADLDEINKKLLVRSFTKKNAGQSKPAPKVWCSRDAPEEAVWAIYMNAMKKPLEGYDWERILRENMHVGSNNNVALANAAAAEAAAQEAEEA